ncbi:winged helix-turn-helix transcriptional regulator [Pseudonocardia phyllosphaerae]|uniref:winged helix-turn-helix transcriptional regulator n=1 Tax=Pseudonocardia phyllosphaerae TaxID=3390502 RepID=UPI00397E4708
MRAQGVGAVGRGLGLLADTWTLLILQRAFLGVTRYAGWRETLNISDATLSARLRSLVEADLLEPRPYREGGRERRGYALTERGGDCWKLLLATWYWEQQWVPREVPLPDIVHRECGAAAGVQLACDHCGERVAFRDTEVWRKPGAPALQLLSRVHPRRTRGRLPSDPLSLLPGAMEIIGDRWGATVLGAGLAGVRSFTAFGDELGISPEVLSDRLRRFIELGVMERGFGGTARDGRYRITEKGLASFPIHACLIDWSLRWQVADGAEVDLEILHAGCGERLRVRLVCDRCDTPFTRGSVSPGRPR